MSNIRTSAAFDINKSNWGNKDMFPDMIYIDTNAILDISLQRSKGRLTQDFLLELIKKDGMLVWSQHVIDEVTDFIHTNEYIQLAKSKGLDHSKWKYLENSATDKESAIIAQTVNQKVERIEVYLEQFGDKTDVPEIDKLHLSRSIYTNFGGNRKDAEHVAIANLTGINNFLTQDQGFLRYPNVNVYGASREITSNYQIGQASAPYVDLNRFNDLQNVSESDEESAS